MSVKSGMKGMEGDGIRRLLEMSANVEMRRRRNKRRGERSEVKKREEEGFAFVRDKETV